MSDDILVKKTSLIIFLVVIILFFSTLFFFIGQRYGYQNANLEVANNFIAEFDKGCNPSLEKTLPSFPMELFNTSVTTKQLNSS